jgi:hypothetical protein
MVAIRPVDRPGDGQHRTMTDARFGPALRAALTTPEHRSMIDTLRERQRYS